MKSKIRPYVRHYVLVIGDSVQCTAEVLHYISVNGCLMKIYPLTNIQITPSILVADLRYGKLLGIGNPREGLMFGIK